MLFTGNYELKEEFKFLEMDPDFLELRDTIELDKVVEKCLFKPLDSDENSASDSPSPESTPPPAPPNVFSSSLARGKWLFDNGKIMHNPKMNVFNVENEKNDAFMVKLFPKEKCSCHESTDCCHIIACKLSLGKSCFYFRFFSCF